MRFSCIFSLNQSIDGWISSLPSGFCKATFHQQRGESPAGSLPRLRSWIPGHRGHRGEVCHGFSGKSSKQRMKQDH